VDLGLKGKGAIVTGGSLGIGRAIALDLAREGANVAVNYRRHDTEAKEVVAEIEKMGRQGLAVKADVSSYADAEKMVKQVRESFGRLDILVCNAGGPPPTSFAAASEDAFQQGLDLNLLSTVHLARAAVPGMRGRRWGRVVCITSVAAKQPLPGLLVSSMARAGVHGFAKALADEVARDGVTVTVVAPGYVRTGRVAALLEERSRREGRPAGAILDELVATVPLGRIGEPDELAAAVAFLASERASYITGTVLAVDGGYLRAIG